MQKKAALQEQIDLLRNAVQTAKSQRRETPKHVALGDLPEAERFKQLGTQSKHLVDTLKMIAYRAETAMAGILREQDKMSRPDEARTLLQALYKTEADLLPDHEAGTLTIRLHHSANASTDGVIQKLCDELNETETVFPRTNLRLFFKVGYS